MLRHSIALRFAAITTAILAAAPLAIAQTSEREVNLYRSHIEFLANPFMEGRGPGTRGNEIAAEYIESTFDRLHLSKAFGHMEPGLDRYHVKGDTSIRQLSDEMILDAQPRPVGDWREPFTAGTRSTCEHSKVWNESCQVKDMSTIRPFEHIALGFSGDGSVVAPLVFVGYAIQKGGPDGAYNTFVDTDDLSGKIAVMFRFEPLDDQGRSRWKKPTDTNWSSAAALAQKIGEVVKHKAAGLIIVMPPGVDDPRKDKFEATESTGRWHTALDIPAVMMDGRDAERMMKIAGQSLDTLRRQADERGGVTPLNGCKFGLDVKIDRSPRTTWNVGALLPGRGDLAEHYIIIGAHYDHVGYGYTGGSRSDEYGIVHPGADDNASGASGLLLAAEVLKKQYDVAPKDSNLRSIMFVAFSAEEMGLIGSREFMKACPVEAKSIDCMLNMDMIGRLRDNHLEVSGTGTAEGFADLLQPLFAKSGLSIQPSPGGRGPSDHATFYGAGIPVLHFFTGQHEQYHTPRDTVDLINVPGAVQVVHLVCDIAESLAKRPDQLAFKSTDKKGEKPDQPAGPTLGGLKVRFGIAPGNYADGEAGVLVGEVYPGTCAAEAGIQPGDRLIRWNGKDIGDVANWMTYLAEHKPGDTVDVDLKRKGEEIRVRVTLKSRDQAPK